MVGLANGARDQRRTEVVGSEETEESPEEKMDERLRSPGTSSYGRKEERKQR